MAFRSILFGGDGVEVTNAAPLVVTLSDGVVDGDQLYIALHQRIYTGGTGVADPIPAPSGWALTKNCGAVSGSHSHLDVYTRTASSESGTVTFTPGTGPDTGRGYYTTVSVTYSNPLTAAADPGGGAGSNTAGFAGTLTLGTLANSNTAAQRLVYFGVYENQYVYTGGGSPTSVFVPALAVTDPALTFRGIGASFKDYPVSATRTPFYDLAYSQMLVYDETWYSPGTIAGRTIIFDTTPYDAEPTFSSSAKNVRWSRLSQEMEADAEGGGGESDAWTWMG